MTAPGRPARLALAAGVAVVVALAAAAGWSRTGDDTPDPPSAALGDTIVTGASSEIDGGTSEIVVPGRRYEIVVSGLREEIDAVTAEEADIDPVAADGTRFVGVAWELGADESAPDEMGVAAASDQDVSPRLSLVVDGEPVTVGALDDEGPPARWVVVPAEAGVIGVAVEYDGVTQTVDDATRSGARPRGGPDLLAGDPPQLHRPECPEPEQDVDPARFVAATCSLAVSDPFPYHRELGWADDGRGWVVVSLRVDRVSAGWIGRLVGGGNPGDYEVAHEDVVVSLGDLDAVATLPSGVDAAGPAGLQADGHWEADVVFSVPAAVDVLDVAFARPYAGRPTDPDRARAAGAPDEIAGTYAASFTVEVG